MEHASSKQAFALDDQDHPYETIKGFSALQTMNAKAEAKGLAKGI
jgi:hypothetical protein